MRMRLGLLRDTAQIEKRAAKEAAEATAKRHKSQVPTVKTEAQAKAEEAEASKLAKEMAKTKAKPRIRPLSEAKAIESGANFISEAFLFAVAGGLIVFESWRSKRKETTRREDVASRISELEDSERLARKALVELEREVLRLRALNETGQAKTPKHIISPQLWRLEEQEEEEDEKKVESWMQRITTYIQSYRDETGQSGNRSPASPVSTEKAAHTADDPEKHASVPISGVEKK
ncbi:putative opa3 domain protein [Phaeomoniella chlamydospora]|uniref:Putative opa3 domain protein n=1 Tax=Phaeomoniella chlamydospora TaxID=158046 RepID=A0A0G2EWJ2_PHACM|nr:putative opa3 domain protein [Phaeomoniella chlamydospora]